jgi:protein regulator of cytokinesis 1
MDTSYLAQQVNSIIGQLHGLFDEIGVPNHDREAREEEVRGATLLLRPLYRRR